MSKEELRKRIDEVDEEIVSLLIRRMKFALEIGELKKSSGEAVRDSGREAALLEKVGGMATHPLAGADLKIIFDTIMSVSRRLQNEKQEKEK